MGDAMLAAVRDRATTVKEHRDGTVDFNAWWRDGDDLNVRLWPSKGAVHDVKTGETMNAKTFADVALGLSLPEMMAHYGLLDTAADRLNRARVPVVDAPVELQANHEEQKPAPDLSAAWARIVEGDFHHTPEFAVAVDGGAARAARWLVGRGFPDDVRGLVEFTTLAPEHLAELPDGMARHAEAMGREHGPCLLAPLRSVADNKVRGIHCRPLDGSAGRHLSGSRLKTDAGPTAYGLAGAARRMGLVVLTEGLADTFAAGAWLRGHPAAVVGAPDVAGFGRLAADLVEHPLEGRRVVLVPHLDDDKKLRDKAAAAVRLMREAGIRSALFDWPGFLDSLKAAGEPDAFKVVRDLADAPKHAQSATWEALRTIFLDTLTGLELKP